MHKIYASAHKGYASVHKGYASMHKGYASVHKGYASVHKGYASVHKGYASVQTSVSIPLSLFSAPIVETSGYEWLCPYQPAIDSIASASLNKILIAYEVPNSTRDSKSQRSRC